MTDRGQSEVIGFVFVFSLIVASTGIVYVAGFSTLEDSRTAEQLNNVERAFEVLDDNMQDLSRREAPTRATEIDLAGGGMRLGDPVTVTVNATNASNSSDYLNVSATTRPIVYEKDDRQVVYAYGATLRQNGEASAMVADPDWVVSDQRSLLPLIVMRPADDRTAVGGQTTVLVRTQADSRGFASSTVESSASTNLTVTIESPRAEAWGRFAERSGFTVVGDDGSDGDVTFNATSDTVVIQLTTTAVNFDL